MVISRKSWHYRYLDWSCDNFEIDLPKSLCGYFWKTVLVTVLNLLMGSLIVGIILTIPLLFWSWLHNGSPTSKIYLILLSVLAAVPCSAALIIKNAREREEKLYQDRRRGIFPKEKPAGFLKVIWETIKARKNKVCPLIKYEG